MSGIIFLGPTLTPDEAREILPRATIAGPVRCGDILASLAERPDYLAIIDGYFGSQRSVWHKEILCALSLGVPVYGAASMGALRAAELHMHGMIGSGTIFEWYKNGLIEADDEVAVFHAPRELGYLPLSLALVDLRSALLEAAAAGLTLKEETDAIITSQQSLFYGDRTLEAALSTARIICSRSSAVSFIANSVATRGLKSRDAKALLQSIAATSNHLPKSSSATAIQTMSLRRLIGQVVGSGHTFEGTTNLVQRDRRERLKCWPAGFLAVSLLARTLACYDGSHRPQPDCTQISAVAVRVYIELQLLHAFHSTTPVTIPSPYDSKAADLVSTLGNHIENARGALSGHNGIEFSPPFKLRMARKLLLLAPKTIQRPHLSEVCLAYGLDAKELRPLVDLLLFIDVFLVSLSHASSTDRALLSKTWHDAYDRLSVDTFDFLNDAEWISSACDDLLSRPLINHDLVRFGYDQGREDIIWIREHAMLNRGDR